MDQRFKEIQQTILDAKASAASLNALEVLTESEQSMNNADSKSYVSIWRRWVWVFAFALWLHEKIVLRNAENSRPQNQPNFKETVLNFRDGLELVWKNYQWQYDLTDVPDADARKIIGRCAVLEPDDGDIVVKIAVKDSGEWGPASDEQEARILAYLKKMKVPGVTVRLINQPADLLKVVLTVYVNPLEIDLETGRLLSAPDEIYPVLDAIESYLGNLEFNGTFVKDFFKAQIRAAAGVKLAKINSMQWKYQGFPYTDFDEWQLPESGHFRLPLEDLTIIYLSDALVSY